MPSSAKATMRQLFLSAALAIFVATSFVACRTPEQQHYLESGFVTNRTVLPVNQTLTPAGQQIELPGMRPLVITLSPDGKLLITSGHFPDLLTLDPDTGKIFQRVAMPSDANHDENDIVSSRILHPDLDAQVSYTGLIFS